MRSAQVYLRCIWGGKIAFTPVFTLESEKVTKVTFIRCHLQCYTLEVSDTSIRKVGHINSKCRTHQFGVSVFTRFFVASVRHGFYTVYLWHRLVTVFTRFFVASVRHGFYTVYLWHRLVTVFTRFIFGIGSTRFLHGLFVASVRHGLFGASVGHGFYTVFCGIGWTRFV